MHRFLQGLIQLAAAYHHCQRGTLRGGSRLFISAFEKLEIFPADYGGVILGPALKIAKEHSRTVMALVEQADQLTRRFEPPVEDREYPSIVLSEGWQAKIPPNW